MGEKKQEKPDKHKKIKVNKSFNELLKLAAKPPQKPKKDN